MKIFTFPLTGLVLSASMAMANPGHDQHAALLGVDPALYTEAELIELGEAIRENDSSRIAFVKSRAEGVSASRGAADYAPSSHQGKDMLARIAGVNPELYTEAELIELGDAMRENDTSRIAFLKSRAEGVSVSKGAVDYAPSSHPGKDMLAKIAGVDPDDYTLAELSTMTSKQSDD